MYWFVLSFNCVLNSLPCLCTGSWLIDRGSVFYRADLISYRSCHMSSRPLLFGGVLACIFILIWSGFQPACSTMAKVFIQYSHPVSLLFLLDTSRDISPEGRFLTVSTMIYSSFRVILLQLHFKVGSTKNVLRFELKVCCVSSVRQNRDSYQV